MNLQEKISVIIPCYNGARFLSQTLESLLWQSHTQWECIVVDDGSTDDSPSIIQNYIKKDHRFRMIRKINGGLASARNTGIHDAQGDFIQFLDADDILLPDRLERCLRTFSESPAGSIVYSDYTLYTKRDGFFKVLPGKIPGDDQLKAFLFEFNRTFVIPIHAYLFRADLVKANLFDESLRSFAEDNEYRIRLALAGHRFDFVDDVLVVYRMNDAQVTSSHEAEIFRNMLQSLTVLQQNPLCARYQREFAEQFRYLHQRIIIGHFMRKEFRSGFEHLRMVRGTVSFRALIKVLLWAFMMVITKKETIAMLRTKIGGVLSGRSNGWEMKNDWMAPQELVDLMRSE